jgi:hypothetical protein
MIQSRLLWRITLAIPLIILVLALVLFLIPEPGPKPPAPLPFDTNGLTSTTTFEIFPSKLPPNPSFKDYISFAWLKLMLRIWGDKPNPHSWTFPISPTSTCQIQVLLNQCMQSSGVRYLMPTGVAVGTLQFGTTNVLDGVQMIKAVEHALRTASPEVFDSLPGRPHSENLVLIRYPEQNTVLVLTKTTAAEFRRTNSSGIIDAR